jgi:phage tail-like protein
MEDLARPFASFKFEVSVEVNSNGELPIPLCRAAFAECTGIEATLETKVLREGGNNGQQYVLPAQMTYGQVSLKRGMTETQDLWRWFQMVAQHGKYTARAQAQVRVRHADGSPGLTFVLFDCLPVKIKAPSLAARDGGIAIEEMTMAYNAFIVA